MKTVVPFAACALVATAFAQTSDLRPPSAFTPIADSRERAAALFVEAGKVLQHPRCVNCHPSGDRPLQGELGKLHDPPVTRGANGHGGPAMQCATCHTAQNFRATAKVGVPGHPEWHLAPLSMAWQGKSLRQICEQLKDRTRNGNKSMDQMVEHMAKDTLVGWGWQPGTGRAPAPGTQEQLGALIRAWADAGAHCPA